MSRFQAAPDPCLRPYVHSYWGLVRDLSSVGGFTVTPDRYLELIFFIDPPWAEDAGGPWQLPACTLIPLLARPLRLLTKGVVRCAAVRWHAWAGDLLLPPANTSSRNVHDSPGSCAAFAPVVCAALRRGDWQGVAAILDKALPGMLAGRPPVAPALAAARTFAALPDEAAALTTGEVAARQGRSRRQIERQVRNLTRHSPKQLSSLARFQFVRDTLWARPGTELAALAFEAGYADQAHMTRQFRRYASRSPGEFVRDCVRLKAFVQAQDVAFVQDG